MVYWGLDFERPSSMRRQLMLAAVKDLTSPLVRCNVLRALKFGVGALHLAQAVITHTTKIAQRVAADGEVSLLVALAWVMKTYCRSGMARARIHGHPASTTQLKSPGDGLQMLMPCETVSQGSTRTGVCFAEAALFV